MILLFLVAAVGWFGGFYQPESSTLTVKIQGFRSAKGQVGILVFPGKEGFPSDRHKAVRQVLVPLNGTSLVHSFSNLPNGNYAVTVMHDENGNNELDVNFLGIPKEGYAFSGSGAALLGPPSFEKAAVRLEANRTIDLKLSY
ncbi:MAG: DUF2141 domain-containing protein [Bacteroidetes bacterium]|nr:DUF2141 domain-containing protein [Bacteroidota bacterium]